MKALYLFLMCLGAFFQGHSQSQLPKELSLKKCIEIALNNNMDVIRSKLTAERSGVNWRQERAGLLPRIEAGIIHGVNRGRSINPLTNTYVNDEVTFASPRIQGSLLLFNGFQQHNIIKQYRLIYQSQKEEETWVRDQLTLKIITAYLEALTTQELLSLLQTQKEKTSSQFERLKVLNENGAIAPGEYYSLKGELASDQLNLINASNSFDESKVYLAGLLDIPYDNGISLERPLTGQSVLEYGQQPSEIYRAAVSRLPAVKAALLRKNSSDFELKALRSNYSPSVYFNSMLSSNFSNSARGLANQSIPYFQQYGNNLSKTFSVSISIPILSSFRTRNGIALSKINQRENEALLQNTINQLQRDVEQAYFNMKSARERYLILTDQVQAYKESFRTVEIQFNTGVLNVVDYLIAKNKLEKANMDKLINRYDVILRKKILDFYQGNSPDL